MNLHIILGNCYDGLRNWYDCEIHLKTKQITTAHILRNFKMDTVKFGKFLENIEKNISCKYRWGLHEKDVLHFEYAANDDDEMDLSCLFDQKSGIRSVLTVCKSEENDIISFNLSDEKLKTTVINQLSQFLMVKNEPSDESDV